MGWDWLRQADWFIHLYHTELGAAERFKKFAEEYCEEGSREYLTFLLLSEQEFKHARMVADHLKLVYGMEQPEDSEDESKYWNQVSKCIKDRETAAGAGYFAEDLSLQRMQVIVNHPWTDKVTRELFTIIEKDEAMHVRVLEKIAGKHGIEGVIDCHSAGLEELKLKLKK